MSAESALVVHLGGPMKRIWMAGLALGLFTCCVSAQEPPAIKTQKDKVSYAIGMEMGKGVKAQGLDVDLNLMFAGLKDALSGAKPLMSEADLNTIITGLQEEIRQKQMQAMEQAAGENRKQDRKSTRLNSSHLGISHAVFCL